MTYNNLQYYYTTIFNFKHYHKWSIDEIENLIPFEREIYLTLLLNAIEEQNNQLRQQT